MQGAYNTQPVASKTICARKALCSNLSCAAITAFPSSCAFSCFKTFISGKEQRRDNQVWRS